jgi:hypothetical protein
LRTRCFEGFSYGSLRDLFGQFQECFSIGGRIDLPPHLRREAAALIGDDRRRDHLATRYNGSYEQDSKVHNDALERRRRQG